VIAGYFVYSRFLSPSPEEADAERKMIAVLPFENLGSPEDEYFADGMTEEITARLAGVRGLGVIARTSAMQYKNTDKSVRQIGDELGVHYIMEGTIRWQRTSQTPSRIRITPQLIRVSDATHLWADIYDEHADDILRVQSEIATRVIDALDITLLGGTRQHVESIPTNNFEAYTYYLRGKNCLTNWLPETLNEAEHLYTKAVELDSTFALAYAALSDVHSSVYFLYSDRSDTRRNLAKEAADKSLRLKPDLPEGHLALAKYYYHCMLDYDRALEMVATVQENHPDLGVGLAGGVQRRQGRWAEAAKNLKRAAELDPLSRTVYWGAAEAYRVLRDYPEAMRYWDRSIALSPEGSPPMIGKVATYLYWDGSTARAREYLQEASKDIDPEGLQLNRYNLRMYVRLDLCDGDYAEALNKLSSVDFDVFDNPFAYLPRSLIYAETYDLMGDKKQAQTHYESSRRLLEAKVEEDPDDPRFHRSLGIAYAGLGRKTAALEETTLATELMPMSKDAWKGHYYLMDLARVQTMVGEYEAAIDLLDYLLSIPGELSAPLLALEPKWAPLVMNHVSKNC
jgi:TolB-like protein/Flp pilus assembly protein TadD